MTANIVFSLTGSDRVGIVEEVTSALLGLGGNVETSRMARLGGEFAILMLVSLPDASLAKLDSAFDHLTSQGYKVTTTATKSADTSGYAGWLPYRIEVHGADHDGIIHEVAAGLSKRGINIESLETGTTPAPISGTPLFMMTALVAVPADLDRTEWINALGESADRLSVDIDVSLAETL